MHQRRIKIGILILYFLATIISCIQAPYPDELYLQHSATLLVAIILIYATVKDNFSIKSFTLIAVFMLFHIIGARWIYSYTPYDQWIKTLTGFSINSFFGFERNQYDRLIHFLFGFLLFIPIREIYSVWFGVREKLASHLAILFILAASLVYEVFEWIISLVLSPEDAEAYNGQQGDYWDAQKDMALAMLGAFLILVLIQLLRKKTQNQPVKQH